MIKHAGMMVIAALTCGLATAAIADEATDVMAATATLKASFDNPTDPLSVAPVVISGDFGIADWSQGKAGGRALLRRKGETWTLALCSGDALRSTETLRKIGVPAKDAEVLARQLARAEKSIDAATLAKFQSFEGVTPMDIGPLNSKAAGK